MEGDAVLNADFKGRLSDVVETGGAGGSGFKKVLVSLELSRTVDSGVMVEVFFSIFNEFLTESLGNCEIKETILIH